MRKEEKQYDEDGLVIRENKSETKREREIIKTFVESMLTIADAKYDGLPIDAQLRAALIEAKRLKGNAYRRHLSFVTRLVVAQGADEIQQAFDKINHPYRNDATKIHRITHYQTRLLADDKAAIDEILTLFKAVDVQYLRQLVRNAKKEKQQQAERLQSETLVQPEVRDAHPTSHPASHPMAQPKRPPPTRSEKLLYQYLFKLELQ